MSMKQFATEINPLRASKLPGFVRCPLSLLLSAEQPMDSNSAAETGTMIHKGIEAFHKLGSEDAARAVMAHSKAGLPLADTGKAQAHFRRYVEMQEAWGEVVATEQPITATLPPHETDPTQAPIVIAGTLDQIRLRGGVRCVVDAKTGSRLVAADMINEHACQLAAYQLGAGAERAAILRTMDFMQGGRVFYECPWSLDDVLRILEPVRLFVAQVRAGARIPISGSHCRYCPAGALGNCLAGRTAQQSFAASITSVTELFK